MRKKRIVAILMCLVLLMQIIAPQKPLVVKADSVNEVEDFQESKIEVEVEVLNEWENQYEAEFTIKNVSDICIKNWFVQCTSSDEYIEIWNVFPYGMDYNKITKTQMRRAINTVYKDMPALKKYALKYLDEVWKE